MVYASTGNMKCFECGDVGHKRIACPHRSGESRGEPAMEPGEGPVGPAAGLASAAAPRGDGAPPPPLTDSEAGEGHSGQADSQVEEQLAVPDDSQAGIVEVVEANGEGGGSAVQEAGSVQATAAELGQLGGLEAAAGEEEMEFDTDSDCVSVADSQSHSGDLHTLEEINEFLDETFGKSVKVTEFFPDADKFIKSVLTLQKVVGMDLLDEKKRFRLKKHVTSLRKQLNSKKGKKRRLRLNR